MFYLKFVLTFIFFSDMCYTIKTNIELDNILAAHGRSIGEYDYALSKSNFCHVYVLTDKSVLLQSSIIFNGVKGIHFDSVECLNTMVEQDYFPLYDPVSDIECFTSIGEYEAFLKLDHEKWFKENLNVIIDLEKVDMDVLRHIFRKTKTNPKERSVDDVRHLYHVIGVYLMNEHGKGQWGVEKRYGKFNPYYWPFVKFGEDVYSFYQYFREVYMASDVDLSSDHGFNFYVKRKLTKQTIGYKHNWTKFNYANIKLIQNY